MERKTIRRSHHSPQYSSWNLQTWIRPSLIIRKQIMTKWRKSRRSTNVNKLMESGKGKDNRSSLMTTPKGRFSRNATITQWQDTLVWPAHTFSHEETTGGQTWRTLSGTMSKGAGYANRTKQSHDHKAPFISDNPQKGRQTLFHDHHGLDHQITCFGWMGLHLNNHQSWLLQSSTIYPL